MTHKLDSFASFSRPVVCQLRMFSARGIEERETKDDMQKVIEKCNVIKNYC